MTIHLDVMLKAAQWERAKGELRAFVMMQGSYSSADEYQTNQYERLGDRVESFIKSVEDEGLHE